MKNLAHHFSDFKFTKIYNTAPNGAPSELDTAEAPKVVEGPETGPTGRELVEAGKRSVTGTCDLAKRHDVNGTDTVGDYLKAGGICPDADDRALAAAGVQVAQGPAATATDAVVDGVTTTPEGGPVAPKEKPDIKFTQIDAKAAEAGFQALVETKSSLSPTPEQQAAVMELVMKDPIPENLTPEQQEALIAQRTEDAVIQVRKDTYTDADRTKAEASATKLKIDTDTYLGSTAALGVKPGDINDATATEMARIAEENKENPENIFAMLIKFLQEQGLLDTPPDANSPSAQRAAAHLGGQEGPPRHLDNPPGTIGWQEAHAQLVPGIMSLHSSGAAANEDGSSRASNRTCLDGIRTSTITGAQNLKDFVKGPLTCTGGTEKGHSGGTYSHYNGYKLDFRTSDMQGAFNLSLGQKVTQDIGGQKMTFYRHNPDHYDVLFHPV